MTPLRSFIPVDPDAPFPIQNLPYGVFSTPDTPARIGVAIGDQILDLSVLEAANLLPTRRTFYHDSLNRFMAAGKATWDSVRARLQILLREDHAELRDDTDLRARAFVPQRSATMHLPAQIGDFTDFYSSRDHAERVGAMLRDPQNALFPNWLHLPVAYHGRSSSVVVSGTPIRRPWGQVKPGSAEAPLFMPTRRLDFELEVGCFIGPGNALGDPINADDAEAHVFGLVLVNDWSARDIQAWEYQPLGPFLAKNVATTISPWVVPMAALEAFRVPAVEQDPAVLPYLQESDRHTFDIKLQAWLHSPQAATPIQVTETNFLALYWTMAQQIAHHTVNGCNLRPGDLLASGTISADGLESAGCLLERTVGSKQPLTLPNGETRTFFEDGDTLTITGWCQGDGYRIGFGEASGMVIAAHEPR